MYPTYMLGHTLTACQFFNPAKPNENSFGKFSPNALDLDSQMIIHGTKFADSIITIQESEAIGPKIMEE
uniref:Uncharacterized protein n=1 Tax=Romanomermis culicivorax TaxID=13658 RepID=A0A915KPI6_ROMCU